jgi:DnaD/phage-associated family protein
MAQLTIYQDSYINATIISNRFIDEYMTDANDAQLKVYLYLVRMLNAHLETGVSDIADRFNHTEKDVMRSLKYWEKQGLLKLDFDESKNLVGIHMKNLCHNDSDVPSVESTHAPARNVKPAAGTSGVTLSVVPAAPAAEAPEEIKPAYEKPSYSPDQIRAFKNSENSNQIVFVAETYLGRPLSAADLRSLMFIHDVLEFNDDLTDYLLQYCVDREKRDFRYIEKVAIGWKENGVTTAKQAAKYVTRYDKSVYSIMNQLGKNGSPTDKEIEFINRWTGEYGFPQDVILEACDRTVLATDSHRFQYAEGILRSWREQNVRTKADIAQLDKTHTKRPTGGTGNNGSGSGSASGSKNPFNQFEQREIDFEALERQLLSQ